MELLYFFLLQTFYIIIKFINIRMVVEESLYKRITISSLANVIWLASTAFGVGEVLEGNYIVFLIYVIANIVGNIIEDRLRKYI